MLANKVRRLALAHGLSLLREIIRHDPRPGERGTLPCPACGKPFHWSYAGFKVHGGVSTPLINGECPTPGCIRIME